MDQRSQVSFARRKMNPISVSYELVDFYQLKHDEFALNDFPVNRAIFNSLSDIFL